MRRRGWCASVAHRRQAAAWEALPVAVMYKVPFVCVVLNNGYLGLIRQAWKYNFEMDYEVRTWYDSMAEGASAALPRLAAADRTTGVGVAESAGARVAPENEGKGFDFVKFAQACGATGERVTDPKEIQAALRRAVASGVPYVIDVIIERKTDASMGVSIDAIREFE